MKNRSWKSAILALGLLGPSAFALPDLPEQVREEMGKAYGLYKKGAYPQAIQALTALESKASLPANRAMVGYWIGLCQSRLQAFDKALAKFDEAEKLGFRSEDLN